MRGDLTREGNAGSPGSGGVSPYLSRPFSSIQAAALLDSLPGQLGGSRTAC